MNLIDREELKGMLDRGEDFKLVNTLGDLAFQAKHIPGSINIHSPRLLLSELDPEDEIVVYCSDELCPASMMAYHLLERHGYKHVRRYSGGLADWDQAGYPFVGELVEDS